MKLLTTNKRHIPPRTLCGWQQIKCCRECDLVIPLTIKYLNIKVCPYCGCDLDITAGLWKPFHMEESPWWVFWHRSFAQGEWIIRNEE
jgi:hypothetical protein